MLPDGCPHVELAECIASDRLAREVKGEVGFSMMCYEMAGDLHAVFAGGLLGLPAN